MMMIPEIFSSRDPGSSPRLEHTTCDTHQHCYQLSGQSDEDDDDCDDDCDEDLTMMTRRGAAKMKARIHVERMIFLACLTVQILLD